MIGKSPSRAWPVSDKKGQQFASMNVSLQASAERKSRATGGAPFTSRVTRASRFALASSLPPLA